MSSVRKGAIANDVVLRGFQRDNLNVLFDGVRLHGGCPSRMDPPSFHFDFAEVDYIKVIKAPYDLRIPGSLAGMVNAVSKNPKDGLSANLNVSYGSFNYLDLSATGSYGGDVFDALIGYAHKSSDVPEAGNGKLLTDIYPVTSNNRYRSNTVDSEAYQTDTFWIKGGGVHGTGRSEVSYSYQDADHVLYPALLMDADYDRTHRVNWKTAVENPGLSISKLRFQAYLNRVDHLMDDTLRISSTPSMMVTKDYMMETDAETTTLGSKLNADMPVGAELLTTGVDFYVRNWDATNEAAMWMGYAEQPMIPDVDIYNYGLFGEYSYPVSKHATLKGGVRLDHTRITADALTNGRLDSLYQPYFSSVLENKADFTEPTANLQLTFKSSEIPPLSGNLSLRYDNGNWYAEISERFASRQDRIDESLQESETAGWGITDLKAGAYWRRWEVLGGVNNLFDKYYFSHLSYQRDPFNAGVKVPEMGLFAYANLSYLF